MNEKILFEDIISSLEETEESFKSSIETKLGRQVGVSGTIAGSLVIIQALLPPQYELFQSIASVGMILSGVIFIYFFLKFVIQQTRGDKGAPKKSSLLKTRAFYQTPKLTEHAKKLDNYDLSALEEFKDWLDHSIKQDTVLIGIFVAINAFLPKMVTYVLSSVKPFGLEEYLSIEKHPYSAAFFQSLPVSLAVIVFIFSVFLIFIHINLPTHIRYAFYVDRAIKKKVNKEK